MAEKLSPLAMLESEEVTKICAPMVRYSKLAFRLLVRKYECDLAFTPMIMADSFINSRKARDSDFTTSSQDRPLIVQFAANEDVQLGRAAELVVPFSDGVDLNCGCPQRWAMSAGYGACLINKPQLIHDMVRITRRTVPNSEFTTSVKIRIHDDLRRTVDLCRMAESAGVSWISVHGRTPSERHSPVHYDAISTIVDSVHLPVIANGDIKSLSDAHDVQTRTGVRGAMAARGMLENPAMFAGYDVTPRECVRDFVHLSLGVGTPFTIFQHHLIQMLDHVLPRTEQKVFNTLQSATAVMDYLNDNLGVEL